MFKLPLKCWYVFVVRYSEIGLKGHKARDRMEQILVRNLTRGLHNVGISAVVTRSAGRIFVSDGEDDAGIADVLSRTMGIKSFSRAVKRSFRTLDDIAHISVELWNNLLNGKKFAVRARRSGTHDFQSRDIMQHVGDALFPFSAGVDLGNPDVECSIEVRDTIAYFYTESLPGPGGLPLGSEGKLVALVSGGIDSPVAAWYAMKRGSPVDLIFCSLAHPVDTRDFIRAALPLIQKWSHGYDPKIHILDGRKLVESLTDRTRFSMPNITYKRILYVIAQRIASDSGAHGIVTGESLGQVSSQTPESLHATAHNLDIPVMRPLLGFDKDEIMAVARRIGTFPERSSGEFCSLFAANPITKPSVSALDADMENFDLLEEIVETRTVLRGSELASYEYSLDATDTEVAEMPVNALVIDLRSKDKYNSWHYPGAVNADLKSVDRVLEQAGHEGPYVFYCMKGLQSAYAASKARDMGASAFYMDEKKLRKLAEA